ncbi:MAG: T9SS type A sorting domain-containing protein [Chitinophagales bacterium]|nr:T9SS type A sorting domain-containing protein [Chitinophagales bacterium]
MLLFISSFLGAQNLVPNPSFETKTSCPTGNSLITLATPWVLPPGSGTTPDYFNACVTSGTDCNLVDVPKNFVGTSPAASGVAYAGIITLYDYCPNCREYIQVKLNSPLTGGTQYLAQMYVRPGDYNKYLTNNMGMYISTNAISQPSNQPITSAIPQIEYTSIITDTSQWTLVTGTFVAAGGEQYLTIGNFHDNAATLYSTVNYTGGTCALVTGGAMYMIDSVYVGIENNLLPPSASFNSIQNNLCGQTCIDFTDESINNPTAWQWSFAGGNPSSSSLQNPTNICFTVSGNYDATLIVTNAQGSDTITISNAVVVNSLPSVNITQSSDTLYSSLANYYQWYTNGNPISGASNDFYVPGTEGNYVVIITDSNGCSASDTIDFVFSPFSNFSADQFICQKFCVDYFDQSQNNPIAWKWTFESGSPSTSIQQNPTGICYNTPGAYDVTLITTNAFGSDTLLLNNFMTVNATPPFPTITQAGYTLTSSPASSYQWQQNSIDIPGATDQSYTVLQSGFYTVIITDENGCVSSTTLYVLITGIENVFGDGVISVFPNPTNGLFAIRLNDSLLENGTLLSIKNTLGQHVFNSSQNEFLKERINEIDLRSLASGVYLIEISFNQNVYTTKIIINK